MQRLIQRNTCYAIDRVILYGDKSRSGIFYEFIIVNRYTMLETLVMNNQMMLFCMHRNKSRSGNSFSPVSGTYKMQSLALLLLVLPMLALSIPDIYYVRPDDDYSFFDCPDQNNCFTFDEYVEETSRYFTSGSIFIFMAGNHTLQNELNLEGVYGSREGQFLAILGSETKFRTEEPSAVKIPN